MTKIAVEKLLQKCGSIMLTFNKIKAHRRPEGNKWCGTNVELKFSVTHTFLFTLDVTKALIAACVIFVVVLPVFVLQRELFFCTKK